jgi:hypothetical protein
MDLTFVNQCQGDTKPVEESDFLFLFCKNCNAYLVFVQETHSCKEDFFFLISGAVTLFWPTGLIIELGLQF